jgi:hypothetical protein
LEGQGGGRGRPAAQACCFPAPARSRSRKQAEEIPAAPKSMHMTMIWYRAAISGEIPDKI